MMEEKLYDFQMGAAEKTGRYLMYVFNIIFFISGACLFSFALFIQFDKDLGDHAGQLGFIRYYHCAIVNLVGAMLVVLASFIGCFGTYSHSLTILYTYVVLAAVCFVTNLTGAVLMLAVGLESTYSYVFVSKTMLKLIYEYQTVTVDVVQEYVGCCGAYSWQDWTNINMPIPDTCRDQVTGNQYRDSCALVMSRHLETLTGLLSGISLWICFLQLFTFLFVICMYRGIKERREAVRQGNIEYGNSTTAGRGYKETA